MFKQTEDGLTIQIGTDNSEMLIIDSERLEECISAVQNGRIKAISINTYKGYKSDNIDFIARLSDSLEGLHLPEAKFDQAIVNDLHKLKFLGIADNKKDIINLQNFPNLQSLAAEYSKRLCGLEYCKKLEDLTLTNYRSNNGDLTGLPQLPLLRELNLFVSANLQTLNGIRAQKDLRKLQIYRAPKLESIDDLKNLEQLKVIEIESCRRIADFEVLGDLLSLEKIVISESGDLKSLRFVNRLKNLQYINFWKTNVLDGDLSPVKHLAFVGFDDKKNYSLKSKYFDNGNEAWRLKNNINVT